MDAAVRELSYSQAIHEAMAIALESDPRVFLMGEDIGVYGGAFQVTGDLVERFHNRFAAERFPPGLDLVPILGPQPVHQIDMGAWLGRFPVPPMDRPVLPDRPLRDLERLRQLRHADNR